MGRFKFVEGKGIRTGVLYLLGNLFNKAIAFITIPIFTHMLTTNEYGIVNTYTSCASILMVIVGLSLGNSVRNAYVDYHNELDKYLSSIFFLSLINFVIVFMVGFGIGSSVFTIEVPILIFCFFESYGSFIINTYIVRYMMSEEALKRTFLMIVPNLIASVLSIILIFHFSSYKYYGRIIATCIVTFIFGMVLLITTFLKGRTFISKKYWSYSLMLSTPLIFHGLSMTIMNASDKTIITLLRGAAETGIYSLVYNFGMIALVVTASLDSMWVPIFTKKMLARDIKGINDFSYKYIFGLAYIFILILLIGPEVLTILAPKEYWEGAYIIAPLVVAAYFQFLYTLSVNVEFFYKKTKIIARNTLVAGILNIVLNFILIPSGGFKIAAYTTLFSYFVSWVLHYWYCKKLNSELFPLRIYMKPSILIVIFTVVQLVFMDNLLVRWGILGALTMVFLFVGRNIIKSFREETY